MRTEMNPEDALSGACRAVFDHYPTGAIALFDADLRFVYVGGGVLSLVGLSAESMIGSTVMELFDASIVEAVEPIYRAALAGDGGSVEVALAGRQLVVTTAPIETERDAEQVALVTVDDVTAYRETERRLSLSMETFRTAFDAAPIGMALVGLDGRFLEVNAALCDMLGYRAPDLLEFTFQDITHPDDVRIDVAHVEQLVAGDVDRYQMEKRYYDRRGHVIWVQLSAALVRTAHGEPAHFISQIEDISDRKRREEALTRMASRDPLTGLLNRGVFDTDLEAYRRSAERYGDTTGLVVIDLDEFKAVNDRGGHEVGDRMLIDVAGTIRRRVRISDHVYRLGGDEFAVLVPHGTEMVMSTLAESLRVAIEEVVVVDAERTYSVGASIGVATIESRTATTATSDADAALYRDKAKRRRIIAHS